MTKDIESGYVPLTGTRLYYETAGQGPWVVLLHAGFTDRRIWDHHFERLAQRYRVVRYDARGAGKSAGSAKPFMEHEDLLGLLRYLEAGRVNLVGLSMGASTALDLAVAYPSRVETLTLVSLAHPAAGQSEAIGRWTRDFQTAYASGRMGVAAEHTLRLWVDGVGRKPKEVDSAVRELVRRLYMDNLPHAEYQAHSQMLSPPAALRLAEVRAPTLVVAGEWDDPELLRSADLYGVGIAGVRKVVVPGAAHMVPLEQPDAFEGLLDEFLRQHANVS